MLGSSCGSSERWMFARCVQILLHAGKLDIALVVAGVFKGHGGLQGQAFEEVRFVDGQRRGRRAARPPAPPCGALRGPEEERSAASETRRCCPWGWFPLVPSGASATPLATSESIGSPYARPVPGKAAPAISSSRTTMRSTDSSTSSSRMVEWTCRDASRRPAGGTPAAAGRWFRCCPEAECQPPSPTPVESHSTTRARAVSCAGSTSHSFSLVCRT